MQPLVHELQQRGPVVGHEEQHLVDAAVPQGDGGVDVADQVAVAVQVGGDADLALAHGQVAVVVDEHALEGEEGVLRVLGGGRGGGVGGGGGGGGVAAAAARASVLRSSRGRGLAAHEEDDAEAALGDHLLADLKTNIHGDLHESTHSFWKEAY